MAKRRMTENKLYPIVEKYIKKRFKCLATGINRGTRHGRIDVVGIRDVSGDLSSGHELIGVEVKAGYQPFGNAAGQAFGYSIYAHRCYLADQRDSRKPYTVEEIDIASAIGIGLLAISGQNIKEILAAPLSKPIEKLQLEVIHKLGYYRCTLCGIIFRDSNKYKSGSSISQAGIIKASERKKGLVYWLLNASRNITDTRDYVYTRRYICHDCVSVFGEK